VALQSTGISWQPVFTILEDDTRTIVLVNAQHLQRVPGRKTDIGDAEGLADLRRHGLLRARVIPPAPIRAVRELTRSRKTLVQAHTADVNRLPKVLESAHLKRGAVATAILGASGRARLAALLTGARAPQVLAGLARGTRRATLPAVRRAVGGRVKPHPLVLSARILAHRDFLEQSSAQVHEQIARALAPFAQAVVLLDGIPCGGRTAAAAKVAASGTEMSHLPSPTHLTSWAGVCPANKQSGGKRLSAKTTKGSPWLRAVLGEVAQALARSPGPSLHAQDQRLARRRGTHKARMAGAHSVLVIAYHLLKDKRPSSDLGADSFDKLDTACLQRHHVHRLEQLGFTVTLTPKEGGRLSHPVLRALSRELEARGLTKSDAYCTLTRLGLGE
jgi:transposase